MKKIFKIKNMWLVLLIPLVMGIITPGIVCAVEEEVISVGPISTTFAYMNKGQSKTYTVQSDFYPDLMIISFVVNGSGNMLINVTKTDTMGELIGVLEIGAFTSVPDSSSKKQTDNVGVTPCTISINGRFWDYGYGVIVSGLLASFEEGPHKYTITINYN
jgi:hypothetical protein